VLKLGRGGWERIWEDGLLVVLWREVVEWAGETGEFVLGGRAFARVSMDGGWGRMIEERLSEKVVVGFTLLLMRCPGSLGLILAVRERPRVAGDWGSRVEEVRFKPESCAAVESDAADGADPVSAASASALASMLRAVSRAGDRVDAARPSPMAPKTDNGLPSFDGGGMALLSASSVAL